MVVETVWFVAAIGGLILSGDALRAQTPAKPAVPKVVPMLESDPLPPGAELRLGTNRLRLGGPVGYLMFNPDDSTLIVGSSGAVHFWETEAWKETWRTNADAFSCSPDGKHIAKKTSERTIEIWDVAKKAVVQKRDLSRFGRNVFVFDIEFNPKGDALWVGVSRQGVWLYNWAKDEIVHRISNPAIVDASLTQSRDRKVLALRHADGDFAIHDGVTGKLIRQIKTYSNQPTGWQALNQNGTILALAEHRKPVEFFDVATGKAVPLLSKDILKELASGPANIVPPIKPNIPPNFEFEPPIEALRCVFGAKDSLFVATEMKLVAIDLAKKKIVAKASLGTGELRAIALSNDDKMLALGYDDGTVEIRDPATLLPLVADPHPRGAAQHVVFARDGQSLATLHTSKSAVRLWNRREGRVAKTFDIDTINDFPEDMPLAFLPDQRSLMLGSRYRWNLATGARERTPERKERLVAASADTRRWLMVRENQIGDVFQIAVFDADMSRELVKLPLELASDSTVPGHSFRAALSDDGGLVGLHMTVMRNTAPGGDGGSAEDSIVVWNTRAAPPVPVFAVTLETGAGRIELSPDGRFLALLGHPGDSNPSKLWHVSTNFAVRKKAPDKAPKDASALLKRIGSDDYFNVTGGAIHGDVAAFSPDSQFLANSDETGVLIRETLSGSVLVKLSGQQGLLCHLAFSPDGRSLASATTDSTVVLWKVPTFGAAAPGVWKRDDADAMWNNLRGEATLAYQAMANLHAGGDEAIVLLKDKIRLGSDDEHRLIAQAIADLGSGQFLDREKATARLEKWGFRIMPFLADGLARPVNLEQKRRLTAIVERYKNVGIDADELRLNRSVFLLERIGTPGARVVLESLARGHALDLTAQSARAALSRLQKS